MMSGNKMDERSLRGFSSLRSRIVIGSIITLLTILIAGCATHSVPAHQQMIHEMGSNVMPFDLSKTQHVFETADHHLVTAIHRWFGAQLSDHGADATYK